MNSRDPPSKILLLIITHLPPSFPLTNDYIHEVFCQYGLVKKILIFERGKANKAFVEFEDIKSAIAARKGMLGKYIAQCGGKLQIHFSKLKKVDLEVVDNSRGSEYTPAQQKFRVQDDFYFTKQSGQEKVSMTQNLNDPAANDFNQLLYSKTDDPNLLSQQFASISLDNLDLMQYQQRSQPKLVYNHEKHEPKDTDSEVLKQVNNILDEDLPPVKSKPLKKIMYLPKSQQPMTSFSPVSYVNQTSLQTQSQQFLEQFQQLHQNVQYNQRYQQQMQFVPPLNNGGSHFQQQQQPFPPMNHQGQHSQLQADLIQNFYLQQMIMEQQRLFQVVPEQQKIYQQDTLKGVGTNQSNRNEEIDNLLIDDEDESCWAQKPNQQFDNSDISIERSSTLKVGSWRNQQQVQSQLQNLSIDQNSTGNLMNKQWIKNPDLHEILTQKPSKNLNITNINNNQITCLMLFNLLSKFGNIEQIVLQKYRSRCLVAFQTIDYATIAKELLGNLCYFGNNLRIYFSQDLQMSQEQQLDEVLVVSKEQQQIQDMSFIVPPSREIEIVGQIDYKLISTFQQMFNFKISQLDTQGQFGLKLEMMTLENALELLSILPSHNEGKINMRFK